MTVPTTPHDRREDELIQAQKMEAIGRLVPGIAHDLDNQLAAIMAFSQLLRRDPRLPDDLRNDAELLVKDADLARLIVKNLFDYLRHRPPERHPTRLGPLVASIVDLLAYQISSVRIQVEVDVPDDLPSVPIDRQRMQQVLLNVALNAIQAIRSRGGGGRLWIRATIAPDGATPSARLTVTDDGPGIAEGHRARLFRPSDTTDGPDAATSLGLSVSEAIVTAHGGRLTFEPAEGGGASFVIDLPLGTSEPPETQAEPSRPPPTAPDSARPRVLVIDDEPSIRRFITKALAITGCDAEPAEDGPSALDLVRDTPYDAVLCDHRMAAMSGTDIYDAVVAIRPELAGRFVLMSGDVLDPVLREFAERHGLGLLAKPFDIEGVGRSVRAVIGAAPG